MRADNAHFKRLADALEGVKFMTADQGRQVYDHLRSAGASSVLDVGTCYGASAAYMAGALQANGGGVVVTVDSAQFDAISPAKGWCEETWQRAGVSELIDPRRIEHTSYAWWLAELVRERSDASGRCEPLFDFAYLDGAKNLALDGVSIFLIERLLKPGGWLLLDDVTWTYEANNADFGFRWGEYVYAPSPAELRVPHIGTLCRLLLEQSPRFDTIRYVGDWAWARKSTLETPNPRVVTLPAVTPRRTAYETVRGRAGRAVRRLRRASEQQG